MLLVIVGIVLVAGIVGLLVSLCLTGNPIWPGIGENLVAELIGAVITVVGVTAVFDWQKRREAAELAINVGMGGLLETTNAIKDVIRILEHVKEPMLEVELRRFQKQFALASHVIHQDVRLLTAALPLPFLEDIGNLERVTSELAQMPVETPNEKTMYLAGVWGAFSLTSDMLRAHEQVDAHIVEYAEKERKPLHDLCVKYGAHRSDARWERE